MDQQMSQPPMTPEEPKKGGGKRALWIILAILIIAGLVWYFNSKKGGDEYAVKSTSSGDQTQPAASGNQPMSLKDLMAGGGAKKCTFTFSQNANTQSQGTVYVAGGKMSGDFSVTVNGKQQMSHMINDGTTVYTWVDGMGSGFKMAASASENQQTPPAGQNSTQSVDPNSKYDYNCSNWSVDNNEFTPPSSVTFTDFSAMMKQNTSSSAGTGASAGASGSASQCAACNNAGSAKAQCLAALHCAQ